MHDLVPQINDYLAETGRLLEHLNRRAIAQAAEILPECYLRQGRVWTAGNGGSAPRRPPCGAGGE